MGYSGLGADVTVTQESRDAASAAYRRAQQAWHLHPRGVNGLAGSSLSAGAITALLGAVVVLGGIGVISKKQREQRFRSKLGLRGWRR